MGKQKLKTKGQSQAEAASAKEAKKTSYTLAELRDDKNLGYRIRVLIYDLRNMTKDKSCENRTLQTTDALYISGPYFSADEAAIVKSTMVDDVGTTLEQAISGQLESFFEKRRASGDCRPCGPHDMVPVYLSCFGIDKSEVEDEKFMSRLRRCGLGAT